MRTPSLVSDSSDVTRLAPSELAKNPAGFNDWRVRAKVILVYTGKVPQHVLTHFDDLYRMKLVPKALQGDLPNPCYKMEAEFQETVQKWAATIPATEEDKYGIVDQMRVLALAHYRIHGTSDNHTNEHGQHRGVDDILEIAFSSKFGCRCKFSTEDCYRLVQLDSNPNAQADTLITIPFHSIVTQCEELALSFTDPTLIHQLYWSANSSRDGFSIIVFPGEFKKNNEAYNMSQLIMVLTTAQSQCKALSLENSVIMGATSCRGRVQIYSSYWGGKGDTIIHIYEHIQQFNLTNPIEVIRFYVFCVKLEKSLQEKFIPLLQEFVAPTEIEIKGLVWHSADQIKKTSETWERDGYH